MCPKVCKSHNLVENVYPSGGFHFRAEKQTRCHLHIGATQTSPPLQNRSAKGAECEAGSTTTPGSSSRRRGKKKKKNQNRECSAGPSAALGRTTHVGPSGQSRRRREAGRRAGLPPEPGDSRPTLAGAPSPSLAPAASPTRSLS